MAAWARERDPSRPLHYERDWSLPRRRRLQPHVRDRTPRSTRSAAARRSRSTTPRWTPAAADAVHPVRVRARDGQRPGRAGRVPASCSSATRAARAASSGSGSTTACAATPTARVFAYGGDFGEPLHDGNFVADGLLFPDRTPSPGLLEFKKVIEPVRIAGDADARLRVDEPARLPRPVAPGVRVGAGGGGRAGRRGRARRRPLPAAGETAEVALPALPADRAARPG